jgi:hypothetical protein
MPAPKRPNYFQSQFLVVRDFQDEQTYHEEMLRRHNRLMHEWGVVRDGLQVRSAGDDLKIETGSAIDALGREIVLEDPRGGKLTLADLTAARQAAGAGQDVSITIAFQEVDSPAADDKYPPPGGDENVTRKVQSPIIAATKSPATDGTVIILARVKANGAIDNTVRKLAGGLIAPLDGALSFTSKNNPNPSYPQVGLDYDLTSDALRIRARSQTASALDVTHITITRDSGFVGLGTQPGQKLEVAGALKLSTNPTVSNDQNAAYFWNQANVGPTIAGGGFEVRTGGDTPRLKINSAGNVGIGTTEPGFPLSFADVLGDKISLWGKTGSHYGFGIQSEVLQIHTDGDFSDVAFGYGKSSSFSETMRIKGSGKVGIGTPGPQVPLHVKGNAAILNLEGEKQGFIQLYPKGFAAGRKGWLGFGSNDDSHLRMQNEADGGNVILASAKGYVGVVGAGGDGQGIQFGNREIKFRGDGLQHFSIFANKVNKALTFARSGSKLDMDTSDADIMTLVDTGNVTIGTPPTPPPAGRLSIISPPGPDFSGSLMDFVVGDIYKLSLGFKAFERDACAYHFDLSNNLGNKFEKFMVFHKGNVGIGSTDPQSRLAVRGGEKLVQVPGMYNSAGGSNDRAIYYPPGTGIAQVREAGLEANDWVVMRDQRRQLESVEPLRVKDSGFTPGGTVPMFVVRAAEGPIFRVENYKGNSQFTVNNDGKVGIGTTDPQATLQIGRPDPVGSPSLRIGWGLANNEDRLTIYNSSSYNMGLRRGSRDLRIFAKSTDGDGHIYLMPNDSVAMTLLSNGNVGIGTPTPTQAKLVVMGSIINNYMPYGFLNQATTGGNYNDNRVIGTQPYSIYADARIAASEFNATSDERIKDIQGRSDSATDLRTVLSLEVVDFRYKDQAGKGNALHKKLIAQQVEKVFPQAVTEQVDVVPDIYQLASCEDGWVELATDMKKGERVRLISDQTEGVYEVLEVTNDKFRTDFKSEGDRVFVFGREVSDFRSLDYDAIAMLNVSATQQLKKEKDEEVKSLRTESAELKAANDALTSRLHLLESKMETAPTAAAGKQTG